MARGARWARQRVASKGAGAVAARVREQWELSDPGQRELRIEKRNKKMATAEKVFQFNLPREPKRVSQWLALVFGCSHRNISRPFTRQGRTYRSCVDCGA